MRWTKFDSRREGDKQRQVETPTGRSVHGAEQITHGCVGSIGE